MSGVVEVNNRVAWIYSSWVFDAVMDPVRDYIPPKWKRLYDEVCDATRGGFRFLSMERFHREEVRVFLAAIEAALAAAEKAGPASFHDPTYFPAFLDAFRELVALVQSENDRRQRRSPKPWPAGGDGGAKDDLDGSTGDSRGPVVPARSDAEGESP